MSQINPIITNLRKRGYRITPQREILVDILTRADKHLSAEEIFSQLKERTQVTNISTVYRTLDVLWEEGFTCRNDLSEGKIVYATVKHGQHIHLVCRRCGNVRDADMDLLGELGKTLRANYKFDADLDHISIFGECADCSDNEMED